MISDEQLREVTQKTLKTVGVQVHMLSEQLKEFVAVFRFELNRTGHSIQENDKEPEPSEENA